MPSDDEAVSSTSSGPTLVTLPPTLEDIQAAFDPPPSPRNSEDGHSIEQPDNIPHFHEDDVETAREVKEEKEDPSQAIDHDERAKRTRAPDPPGATQQTSTSEDGINQPDATDDPDVTQSDLQGFDRESEEKRKRKLANVLIAVVAVLAAAILIIIFSVRRNVGDSIAHPSAGRLTQIGNDVRDQTQPSQFGSSLALSADGTIMAVGAPGNSNGNQVGQVFIYTLDPTNNIWQQYDGQPLQGTGFFGAEVALSGDGSLLVIGGSQGSYTTYSFDGSNWYQRGSSPLRRTFLLSTTLTVPSQSTSSPNTSPSAATSSPTSSPSTAPTGTSSPTVAPSAPPITGTPNPTESLSAVPTVPSASRPTSNSSAAPPSDTPSLSPTSFPSTAPTGAPTSFPSSSPTASPSAAPSVTPSSSPTSLPSMAPTGTPTTSPTSSPTASPSPEPTVTPTSSPTMAPSGLPTFSPTASPSTSVYATSMTAASEDGQIVAIAGAGAANIFQWNNEGYDYSPNQLQGYWMQYGTTVTSFDGSAVFGSSIALSTSGNVLAVGAPSNSDVADSSGKVRIYSISNVDSVWQQVGNDISGDLPMDRLGFSVALSADVSILATGLITGDQRGGEVRAYRYDGNAKVWTNVGISATGEHPLSEFGYSISLSSDGTKLAIGAPRDTNNGRQYNGLVQVFNVTDGVWTQIGNNLVGDNDNDGFGTVVALSGNGTLLTVAAPGSQDLPNFGTGYIRTYQVEL